MRGDPFLSVGRGECEGHMQVQVERSPGRGQVASVCGEERDWLVNP